MRNHHTLLLILISLSIAVLACSFGQFPRTPTPAVTAVPPPLAEATTVPTATTVAASPTTPAGRPSRSPGPVAEGNLAYGDNVQGEVPEDSSATWTFSGTAGESITLSVEPLDTTLDVTVDVLAPDGSSILAEGVVDEAFGTETIQRLELPEDGDYTILLRGFAGSGGDYALNLNALTATEDGDGLILSLDNTIVSKVGPDEANTYFLTQVISRPVTILVEPDPDFDVVVELYGSEGELLDSSDVGFEGESERLSVTPLGGNIQVSGYTGTGGGYTLTLLAGSPEAAGSTILTQGSITAGEEEHVFPFSAPAGQLVSAYAEPEEEFDLVLEVWSDEEEGTLLETVDFSFGPEQLNFMTDAGGNYFFTLSGFDGDSGNYSLTLEGTDATVFEIAPGDIVDGRLGQAMPLEYNFRLEPGATIFLTATGDEETDVTLAVEDLDGNLLAAADDTAIGESESLAFSAPPDGGDHFLLRVQEFSGSAGAFTLQLQ